MMSFLRLAIACALVSAMISTADAARREKRPVARQTPSAQKTTPDQFKACDVQLREYLREGGTWLTPKEIKVDEARLTINVTHAFGESGKSIPRFLRGDTEDEKRQQLRADISEMHDAIDAVKIGKAWFLIASKKTLPPDTRTTASESTGPWYGVLLAEIRGRCRTMAHYRNVSVENLPPEVRSEME